MKAIGMYIFSGSQTIGHMKAGWDVDRVLEMTDDMRESNAFHFVRNYNIPIIIPSVWNSGDYLDSLVDEYDLLFANPPCSGLSAINRNAGVDNDVNKHIYEVANVIKKIRPKTFLIENAPTLIAKGLPILKDIQKLLSSDYRVTIITDLAGNHSVPMYRKRTLVVGWRRDVFEKIPAVQQIVSDLYTVEDAFRGLDESVSNMSPIPLNDRYDFSRFYKNVPAGDTVVKYICDHYYSLKDQLTEDENSLVLRAKEKYDKGGSVWDKSPLRLELKGRAPSITSVNRYIHPTEDRDIYIRECARLMGYPDSYKFYDGSTVSVIQCVAQGVPVNFIKYISSEIMRLLNNPVYTTGEDVEYINQANGIQKCVFFTTEEFQRCNKIDRNECILREESLW